MYTQTDWSKYRRPQRKNRPIGSKGTVAEKLCAYLISKGFTEVPSKTTKYRMFSIPSNSKFYFVGRNGALRRGTCISKSYSINLSPSAREAMLHAV